MWFIKGDYGMFIILCLLLFIWCLNGLGIFFFRGDGDEIDCFIIYNINILKSVYVCEES